MGKRNKKEKVELSHKEKIKKILSICLCSFLVLLIAAVLFIYYGYRDPYRNTYINKDISPTSLIEKNIIDGFKDTNTTGKFSFKLSNDDVNELLSNATKDDLGKHAKSIYYVTSNNHHYFMVDLKGVMHVKSRVAIDTYIQGYTENNEVMLGINKVTTGRLSYTKTEYLSDSFFNNVSTKSLLPITYIKESNAFLVSPLKFLDYLPNGELTNIIKDLSISNPSIVSLSSETPFGFDIDLSLLRSSKYMDFDEDADMVDIVSTFKDEVAEDIYLSLEEGVDTNIYNLSLSDYNNIIRYGCKMNALSETFVSHLTENKLNIEVKDVYAVLEVDIVKYILNISINGYDINFWINSTILNIGSSFNTTYELESKVNTNGCTFNLDSKTGVVILNYMNTLFKYLESNTSFIKYNDISLLITFDFSELTSIYPGFMSCVCSFRQDNINLDKFIFSILK